MPFQWAVLPLCICKCVHRNTFLAFLEIHSPILSVQWCSATNAASAESHRRVLASGSLLGARKHLFSFPVSPLSTFLWLPLVSLKSLKFIVWGCFTPFVDSYQHQHTHTKIQTCLVFSSLCQLTLIFSQVSNYWKPHIQYWPNGSASKWLPPSHSYDDNFLKFFEVLYVHNIELHIIYFHLKYVLLEPGILWTNHWPFLWHPLLDKLECYLGVRKSHWPECNLLLGRHTLEWTVSLFLLDCKKKKK